MPWRNAPSAVRVGQVGDRIAVVARLFDRTRHRGFAFVRLTPKVT